jgi:hypothetical protein
MSSSAESFDWAAFRERELPAGLDLDLLSPASELVAVLQRTRRDAEAQRAEAERAIAARRSPAAEHAALVFWLGVVLSEVEADLTGAGLGKVHERLCVVQRQMADALEDDELVILDPVGRPFEEIAHQVDVAGWRHDARFDGQLVAQTLEPIVLHEQETVRPGRVIMGAPPAGEPGAGHSDDESGAAEENS